MSRYVVVDFETYPVNGKSLIMEIGCYEVINGEVGKTWETLVKPIAPVSEFVLNLTGINPDALETAPVLLMYWINLNHLLAHPPLFTMQI